MMYARDHNGLIKKYARLPNKLVEPGVNIVGGFDKLPESIHRQYGFYPLVQPQVGGNERLGELYFDEENEVFTYPVEQLSEYELAMKDWLYPEYSLRVTTSALMIDSYPSVAVWLQISRLPIIMSEDQQQITFYANEIKPQHQGLFDSLINTGGLVVEYRPELEQVGEG
jgi:hypothetical protein